MNNSSLINLLNNRSIKFLFKIFEDEAKEISLVGGCVRDSLLGREAKDIDVASNAKPDEIINILENHKIEHKDFAYKYGSIIAIIENQKFQITTLREDVNQIGRHTDIKFTNDWKIDAGRRDFTINSIYLFSDGKVLDYFGGQEDLRKNKLKFIGNIEDRIKEDFLRIYRYYRFLGIFNKPFLVENYENILKRYFKESFICLSNHKLREEIMKMFLTPFPLNCFYKDTGIKVKRSWIELTRKHFIEGHFDIGLNDCLNEIDILIR